MSALEGCLLLGRVSARGVSAPGGVCSGGSAPGGCLLRRGGCLLLGGVSGPGGVCSGGGVSASGGEGGVCSWGGVCSRSAPGGVSQHALRQTPPPL